MDRVIVCPDGVLLLSNVWCRGKCPAAAGLCRIPGTLCAFAVILPYGKPFYADFDLILRSIERGRGEVQARIWGRSRTLICFSGSWKRPEYTSVFCKIGEVEQLHRHMFDFCFKAGFWIYGVKVLTFTLYCYANRYF